MSKRVFKTNKHNTELNSRIEIQNKKCKCSVPKKGGIFCMFILKNVRFELLNQLKRWSDNFVCVKKHIVKIRRWPIRED